MAGLKALYEELGFTHVVTYIQSGNVIFQTKKKSDTALAAQLETAIKAQYGFDVPVVIRTVPEMKAVIANNPFLDEKDTDIERTYVTFLAEVPSEAALAKAATYNYTPDRFIIKGKEVYLHIPVSYGETKLSNTFLEKVLNVPATTRNWRTVNKLAGLGDA